MKRITQFLFTSFWTFDVFVSVLAGTYLGYVIQIEADSGDIFYEEILRSTLFGLTSYLLAFIVGFLLRNRFPKITSWMWMGILGSIIFAFNLCFINYLIENFVSKGQRSFTEYFIWLLPTMVMKFIGSVIIDTLLLLITIFAARLLVYLLMSFFRRTLVLTRPSKSVDSR